MSHGVDVSQHQGSISWAKVKAAGYDFVICKTSEGEDFLDPRWTPARVAAVRKAGLKLGVYHFLRPRPGRTGAVEADFAVRTARAAGWGHKGDVVLACDAEVTGLGPNDSFVYITQFMDRVEELLGQPPMLYTFPAFWQRLGNPKVPGRWSIWIAHFGVPQPSVPSGLGAFDIHQHSSDGQVDGVSGRVDLNRAVRLPLIGRPPVPVPPNRIKVIQRLLRQNGWPISVDGVKGAQTKQAVRDFKRGYGFRPGFRRETSGVGPVTMHRLRRSARLGGKASKHFAFVEFASSHTGWIRTHRSLVRGLEKLRVRVGPIGILSGFRDFNLGASKSQHKFGNAMDPTRRLPLEDCLAVKAFSGIGLKPGALPAVRHLDVRHVGPNFTGGTPEHPTVFNDTFARTEMPRSLIPVWLRREDIEALLAGDVSNVTRLRLVAALEEEDD